MRFDYSVLCILTLPLFTAAGPIPPGSQSSDLSPFANAANAISALSPGKAAVSPVPRQGRAVYFDVSDVVAKTSHVQ